MPVFAGHSTLDDLITCTTHDLTSLISMSGYGVEHSVSLTGMTAADIGKEIQALAKKAT